MLISKRAGKGIYLFMGLLLFGPSITAIAQESRSLREMMITPGKLHSAHSELEANCNACHIEFTRDRQSKLCLDCHQVIAADIEFEQGFHGGLEASACLDCHTEHLGEEGIITLFDRELFDHNDTNFHLKGEHQSLNCGACHNDTRRNLNKLHGEFRLEGQACVDCHDNPHKANPSSDVFTEIAAGSHGRLVADRGSSEKTETVFSDNCSECHAEESWKTPSFDHADTGFILEYKHSELLCFACHADSTYQAPTACQDCHQLQDPHWGAVGEQCADCHETKSWEKVTFDHDETRFPLVGRHKDQICQVCHVQTAAVLGKQFVGDKPATTICLSCHKANDLHEGAYGTDCQSCHSENEWATATFDHNKNTEFKLVGVHQKTNCLACHKPGESEPLGSQCVDCHKTNDVHLNQLGSQCDDCHTGLESWQKPLFDHDFTSFPLVGLHRIIGCQSCHAKDKTFQLPLNQCDECHLTVTKHEHAFQTTCDSCHSTRGWGTPEFDHQQTEFPLNGAHTAVACFTCHSKDVDTPDFPDRRCYACHKQDDVHDQRFGSQCDNCHNTKNFTDVLMNRR